MANTMSSPSSVADSSICPPSGENSMALSSRLSTACCSKRVSPCSWIPSPTCRRQAMWRSSRACRRRSRQVCSNSLAVRRRRPSGDCNCSTRASSSMRSMMACRRRDCSVMLSAKRWRSAAGGSPSRISAAPMTAVSGLFISCARFCT
ncbi:hypothetical protein SDC9_159371 [bioreactor metagenome]|uniref:Uncharacterized protein n=1 Tax=bioreactor metagenome TaxID=1076179 RepID=A0A645FCK5_9ZZZZ